MASTPAPAVVTVLGDPYTLDDVLGTLGALGPWWQQLLDRRVAGGAADVVAALLAEQEAVLVHLLAALGAGEPAGGSGSLERIDGLGQAARTALAAAAPDRTTVPSAAVEAIAGSLGALRDAGEALRAAGAFPATVSGHVAQVSTSAGGVPKRAVERGVVDGGGLVGDAQRTRRHHGRPWQALCLWSAEVVDAFAAGGHPIAYGACGENLTLAGLPWADVRAGVRLRLGEALVEVTVFALPCAHNARWFADRDPGHMHHDRGPVSRVYARVLEGGTVGPGDAAVLEPT